MNHTVILACSSFRDYIAAAQEKMHTDHPVIWLDEELHRDPKLMRQAITEALGHLPESVETVLVCMGFCGGSWRDVPVSRRVVIPRMDDCITMLLTTDDTPVPNRKVPGCMYLTDNRDEQMTIPGIRQSLIAQCGEKKGDRVFRLSFKHYTHIGIIDTGLYDSYGAEYLDLAKESADLINGSIIHVPGSNRVLEKLVSGVWDEQFLILEPGRTVSDSDFI